MDHAYQTESARSLKAESATRANNPRGHQTVPLHCSHRKNKDEHIGECEKCGGPTPYCLKCDVCYCEWCEV